MSDRELLINIHDSYEDFVNTMLHWFDEDASIRSTVLGYIESNPNSSSSDVLKVLWNCIGIGEIFLMHQK
jgi:hypothetical protein